MERFPLILRDGRVGQRRHIDLQNASLNVSLLSQVERDGLACGVMGVSQVSRPSCGW
jgi:hypothetical protein